jgi:hypothetical protein
MELVSYDFLPHPLESADCIDYILLHGDATTAMNGIGRSVSMSYLQVFSR